MKKIYASRTSECVGVNQCDDQKLKMSITIQDMEEENNEESEIENNNK